MGGGKAFRVLPGRTLARQTLIGQVLERVVPQVDLAAISMRAGGDGFDGDGFGEDGFGALGLTLLRDAVPGLGPLGGIAAGLGWAGAEPCVFVPCDVPHVPLDLVERLRAGLGDAAMAHARTARDHYGCVLVQGGMAADAHAALAAGVRSLRGWMAGRSVAVAWTDERAFLNVNTPEDLAGA